MVSKASKAQSSSQTPNLYGRKKKTKIHIKLHLLEGPKKGEIERESTNYQTLEIAESLPFLTDEKRELP